MGETKTPVGGVTAAWRFVDVGNTHVKTVLVVDGRVGPVKLCNATTASAELDLNSWDREAQIAIASVNPPALESLVQRFAELGVQPSLVLRSDGSIFRDGSVSTDVQSSESIGVDRVLACLGALEIDPGRTVVVVDCGTATTVNVMSPDRCFRGGMIMPGRRLMASSLHLGTAALPEVSMEAMSVRIGKSTNGSLGAGINAAFVGSIERSVAAIKREHPTAEVYLTGGDSLAAQSMFPRFHRREWLTLSGLHWYAVNRGGAQ